MNTGKNENPVALAIVANLAWRARRARQNATRLRSLNWHEITRVSADAQATEAWNAYVTSKKILLGLEP